MAGTDEFCQFVLDQLHELNGLNCRGMFGGHGLRLEGRFFAIVHRGRLYFKTDAVTRDKYRRAGMSTFQPSENQTLKNYFEVPADVLEDRRRLQEWAQESARLEE